MHVVEHELGDRIRACGLDIAEMVQLYEESDIGLVLSRIGEAELACFSSKSAEAANAPMPVGVGSTRWRQQSGASRVLSIRLDAAEADELRQRADESGVGVSVLARAFIRQRLAMPVFDPLD